jgi:GR25 family glycosyltransferase involved in LPS biosynthesis
MKIDYETYVISLARQPEKRAAFLERNQRTGLEFRSFDAVDGSTLSKQDWLRFGLLRPGSRLYTEGHVGCAASHRDLWIYAITSHKHLLVFEDDVYCRHDLAPQLAGVLERLPQFELLLLGYNTDAVIDLQGVSPDPMPDIVLNPRPTAEQLAAFARTSDATVAAKLNYAFGTCAYLVSPQGAQKLLTAFPMDNRPVWLPDKKSGAGLKAFACLTIDMLLNTLYRDMAAYALMPPLALPLNDPVASTTRLR